MTRTTRTTHEAAPFKLCYQRRLELITGWLRPVPDREPRVRYPVLIRLPDDAWCYLFYLEHRREKEPGSRKQSNDAGSNTHTQAQAHRTNSNDARSGPWRLFGTKGRAAGALGTKTHPLQQLILEMQVAVLRVLHGKKGNGSSHGKHGCASLAPG